MGDYNYLINVNVRLDGNVNVRLDGMADGDGDGRLTAHGASILRHTRDAILQHPTQFHMRDWDNGETACIGGWMCRVSGTERQPGQWLQVARLCFGDTGSMRMHPHSRTLEVLFYNMRLTTAQEAAYAINDYLWYCGYPPEAISWADEITTPEPLHENRCAV